MLTFKYYHDNIIQGCGSGSGLDLDSMTCVDPDSESGSRPMSKKNEEKNTLFLNILNIFIAKR
jgi:hypothetical protein